MLVNVTPQDIGVADTFLNDTESPDELRIKQNENEDNEQMQLFDESLSYPDTRTTNPGEMLPNSMITGQTSKSFIGNESRLPLPLRWNAHKKYFTACWESFLSLKVFFACICKLVLRTC